MTRTILLALCATWLTVSVKAQLDFDALSVVVDGNTLSVHQVDAAFRQAYLHNKPESFDMQQHRFSRIHNNKRVPINDDQYVLTIHIKDYILMKEGHHGNGVFLNFGAVALDSLPRIQTLSCIPEAHLPHIDSLAHPYVEYNKYHHVMNPNRSESGWLIDPEFSSANCTYSVVGQPDLNISRAEHYKETDDTDHYTEEGFVLDFSVEVKLQTALGKPTHTMRVKAKGLRVAIRDRH